INYICCTYIFNCSSSYFSYIIIHQHPRITLFPYTTLFRSSEYLPYDYLQTIIKQPLVATSTEGSYDIRANIHGGGYAGQAGAVRHGIDRALLTVDPDFRAPLKEEGYLTRDSRMKQRYKPRRK